MEEEAAAAAAAEIVAEVVPRLQIVPIRKMHLAQIIIKIISPKPIRKVLVTVRTSQTTPAPAIGRMAVMRNTAPTPSTATGSTSLLRGPEKLACLA